MAEFTYLLIMALIVAKLNVRSLKSGVRRALIMDYLESVKADIICVQECGVEDLHGVTKWRKGVAVWTPCCESRSEGVGVLIKNEDVKVIAYEEVVPGRCLAVTLEYENGKLRLFNCYASADKRGRKEFLSMLKLQFPGRVATVVAGDFNCVRKESDRHGIREGGGVDVTSCLLNELVDDFKLKDTAVVVEGGTFSTYPLVG